MNGKVRSKAALLLSGVNQFGYREILGIRTGNSESETSWSETFRWLKQRGLHGVDHIISDNHTGLVASALRCFQGASWLHCQVHLMRNVISHPPTKQKLVMRDGLKEIFDAPDSEEARRRFDILSERLETKVLKALECLEKELRMLLSLWLSPRNTGNVSSPPTCKNG